MLIGKGSAKAAWEAIKLQHQGNDRVRETRARRLRTEFETISFKDGERIDDFGLQITNLAATLRSLGDTCDDEKIVRKFLSVVPSRFVQIAFSMETMMDPATLTVEEVVGHLRAVEDRLDNDQGSSVSGSQLLLTEKQWEERRKQNRGGGSSWSGNRNGGSGQKGGKAQPKSTPATEAGGGIDRNKCRYCGKKGHWAHECRKKQRDEAAAATHLTQEEEGGDSGPGLHMTTVVELTDATSPPFAALATTSTAALLTGEQVYLNEERARVKFRRSPTDTDDSWYLDTGASNHMTGDDSVFAELDRSVSGKVRFGDGSIVKIRGRGTVMFAIDNDRHRELLGVYRIPKLKSNIISIGQLDEIGFPTHVEHGYMSVRDRDKVLIAKVPRTKNRLYVVHLQIVQPVCLSAHANDDAWRSHLRFAHQSFDSLEKLSRKGLVRGLPTINHIEQLCKACITGKHRRASFPAAAKYRATQPLELVHGDICGPITPATHGGKRYFLLLVDDHSRYMWLVLLRTKDEAAAAIRRFKAEAEVESRRPLRVLRTDRGGEFTATEFAEWCADRGVITSRVKLLYVPEMLNNPCVYV